MHSAIREHRLLAPSIRCAIGMDSSLDIEGPLGLAIWSRCQDSTDNERERRATRFFAFFGICVRLWDASEWYMQAA